MAGMTIGGVHSGSAQGGCNESVAHDRLVLGVCALVFELILIFGGGIEEPQQALESDHRVFPIRQYTPAE